MTKKNEIQSKGMNLTNTKEIVVRYEDTYKKSNEFGQIFPNARLTTNQYQLLAFVINRTQHTEEVVFKKKELEEQYNKQISTNQLKRDADALFNLSVRFVKVDKFKEKMGDDNAVEEFKNIHVFDELSYKDGQLFVRWGEGIRKHTKDINSPYFLNSLNIVSNFNSQYTWTVYNLIKSCYHKVYLELPIDYFLNNLGLPKDSYYRTDRYALRKRILERVKEEINEYTEIDFDYEIKRVNKENANIVFYWTRGKLTYSTPEDKLKELHYIAGEVQAKGLELLEMPEIVANETRRQMAEDILRRALQVMMESKAAVWSFNEVNRQIGLLIESHKRLVELEERKDKPEPVPLYNWLEERE